MSFRTVLSKEDQDFAKKELGEYPAAIGGALIILRDKIRSEPGLKANLNDDFLIRFLRARKYDTDRALVIVKNYYSTKNDELLKDFRPSTVRSAINLCISCPMRVNNPLDRSKVVVFRPGLWKSGDDDCPLAHMLRSNMMVMEYILQDEVTQVYGVTMVIDGAEVGWDHSRELAKSGFVSTVARFIQDAMPMRLKGMHFINEPIMMGYIFSLVKPFLKEKLVKRIHFHAADVSSLHQFISPEALPEHLGGLLPPLPDKEFIQDLLDSEEYFKEMSKYYFDDTKTVFKSQDNDAEDSGIQDSAT